MPDQVSDLKDTERAALERRLWDRQSGKCFICQEPIDLKVHKGELDIDHIEPKALGGADDDNNYALTHQSCNRSKSVSDLRVARRMAEFDRLEKVARDAGERGANLGHLLAKYGGAKADLVIARENGEARYSFAKAGDNTVLTAPIFKDSLSGMEYFFAVLPLAYLHHDDRINPRNIGSNVRGLIEEFLKGRPQLHIGLAWWAPDKDGAGAVKVFDGQHKAAAQILLGVGQLPVRIFVEPDTNVLLTANTNAGDKLRQVAFDKAVMRHLGSTLYLERIHQYQEFKNLQPDDYSFSETDLVKFFRGEHREMLKYIVDANRDAISHSPENKLMQFVEWSGRGADRPLSYSSVEKTFYAAFLYVSALNTPIDHGLEQGDNPRVLERDQMIRLMSLFAEVFYIGKWDPEIGGRKLESTLQKGDPIPEHHLRAWRVSREEILANILRWVRLVMENYYAYVGKVVDGDRLLHRRLPDPLWDRVDAFLRSLAEMPCWFDKELSTTVFGAKQNRDFWKHVFENGKTPGGVRVLAKPLDIQIMIQAKN